MRCYCGSNRNFEECCYPLLQGKKIASTAEELMRSRYSAYVVGNGAYLVKTALKENRFNEDIALIEEFAYSVKWLKLELLHVSENTVEFRAFYLENKEIVLLHERSSFIKNDGVWEYAKGEFINSKIERNEPCPCGSGKKYKKCQEHLTTP